jgi:hypothetical protein
LDHLNRLLEGPGPIIKTGKDVAMNVDHWLSQHLFMKKNPRNERAVKSLKMLASSGRRALSTSESGILGSIASFAMHMH